MRRWVDRTSVNGSSTKMATCCRNASTPGRTSPAWPDTRPERNGAHEITDGVEVGRSRRPGAAPPGGVHRARTGPRVRPTAHYLGNKDSFVRKSVPAFRLKG